MEEVEGKRKKRTKQRVRAATATQGTVESADEEDDNGSEADEPASDASSTPTTPRKRRMRTTTATSAKSRRMQAKTKSKVSRRKATGKAPSPAPAESLFDFSTDAGPEDTSEDEKTSSSDLDRSFARIEAAQDALDATDDDDVELEHRLESGKPLQSDDSASEEDLAPLSIFAQPPPGQPTAKRTASSPVHRRRVDTSASTTLARSFTSSKPGSKRSKAKGDGKGDLGPTFATEGTVPDVRASSPLATEAGACSGGCSPERRVAAKKPKKPVVVYVDLSD